MKAKIENTLGICTTNVKVTTSEVLKDTLEQNACKDSIKR